MTPTQEMCLRAVLTLCYAIFEYWIGKNQKVHANSFIELLIEALKNMMAGIKSLFSKQE